jgi:hypothetical protein
MKQRERIEEMEKHFERASEVVAGLSSSLEKFAQLQESVDALEAYYGSKEWKKDFRDDEKGLLPTDLKRGVLSEDGVWNLLEEIRAIKERMQDLSK